MTVIDELPDFFDPAKAESASASPDFGAVNASADEWRRRESVPLAGTDAKKVRLLAIDEQVDFTVPGAPLYVGGRSGRGAPEDTVRLSRFIYRNLPNLTEIVATLDTHFPGQIFFDRAWIDPDGRHPEPFSIVTADDVRQGKWSVNPEMARLAPTYVKENFDPTRWAKRQGEFYVNELERLGQYDLTIWPYHCIDGTPGHALNPLLAESMWFHAAVRGTDLRTVRKGNDPWTESYSVFRPEVRERVCADDGEKGHEDLLDELLESDALVVAGQAASHCVLWSMDHLVARAQELDRLRGTRDSHSRAARIYLLADCTSSVTVPDGAGGLAVDFTPQAEAAIARWRAAGVNVVDTRTEMRDWPMADRAFK